MKPMTFMASALAIISLLGASAPQSVQAADANRGAKTRLHGDAERGRDIAAKWCSMCHATRSANANDQIPTFATIAAGPMGRPDTLRAFLNVPHKPMPPLQLTNQEIEDLVAFISQQK